MHSDHVILICVLPSGYDRLRHKYSVQIGVISIKTVIIMTTIDSMLKRVIQEMLALEGPLCSQAVPEDQDSEEGVLVTVSVKA